MRLVCGVLVVLCCSLLGLEKAQRLKARARALADLTAGLGMLKSEICQRRSPISEIAETLSVSAPGTAGRLFANLKALLPLLDTQELHLLWSGAVRSLGLDSDETYALEQLGLCLGRYEAQAQSDGIDVCLRRLLQLEAEANARYASGSRLYTGLGVTLGLITAVLIL